MLPLFGLTFNKGLPRRKYPRLKKLVVTERDTSPPITTEKSTFFYGYVIVIVAFLILVIFGGANYSFGVFLKPLASEFGWTRAATSGAFSLYLVVHGFLYIITGKLNDRFGSRIVMTGCGFFLGLGFLLMSMTSTIWHLYLYYGLVMAVGMSGGFVPLTSTIAHWFVKRRGLMTGIAVAGVGAGIMVIPPIASWLIDSYGWRYSYTVIGVIILVVVMLAAQFLRRNPIQTQQLPYGRAEAQEIISDSATRGLSLRKAVRTTHFWLLCILFFDFGLFLQAIMVHIVPNITELGIPATTAANIFVAIGALSIIGKVLMGSVSDRIGNKTMIVISFTLATLALAWLLVAKQMWMFYLFAVIFGFAYGGLVSVQSPMVAEIFGLRSHGVILGVIVFMITIGGGLGSVVVGAIFDLAGSYFPAFLLCAIASAIGIVPAIFVRQVR